MSSGQKKFLIVAGGVCTVAAGHAAYRQTKKWDLGSVANIVGGLSVIAAALL
jgi:hypothetical protein